MDQHLKYFKKLGIPPTTDVNLIKKAYRKKAMRVHPDKNPSEDAQKQFVALTEAYEILTGVRKTTKKSSGRPKTTEEVRAEVIRNAKRRSQKMRESKKEKDIHYFERITTGRNKLIFKVGITICLIINIMVTIDFFVDGETIDLPVGTYKAERFTYSKAGAVVWVEEEVFTPYYQDFVSVDYNSFALTRSFLFNKAKYISYTAHTFNDPERFYAYERISIFEWFPYLQIMLILPLLVFLLRRPQPWFSFMRMVCLALIFPGSLIVVLFLLI